ncbi:hypothetical protein KQH82_06025 [bacterium]|nr:hypothetical protein [bacterium]
MPLDRSRILLNPLFIASLAILIINDHVLKAVYPSFISGKLSDFSGLIVFALFLAFLLWPRLNSRRRVFVLNAIVAALWVVWKLAPVELVFDPLARMTGLPMPSRVADMTDLSALVVLPICYQFLGALALADSSHSRRIPAHRAAVIVLSILAFTAMSATSIMRTHEAVVEERFGAELSDVDFLSSLELVLAGHNMQIERREALGQSSYRYSLIWAVRESPYYSAGMIDGGFVVRRDSTGAWRFEDVGFTSLNGVFWVSDSVFAEEFDHEVVLPLLQTIGQ